MIAKRDDWLRSIDPLQKAMEEGKISYQRGNMGQHSLDHGTHLPTSMPLLRAAVVSCHLQKMIQV